MLRLSSPVALALLLAAAVQLGGCGGGSVDPARLKTQLSAVADALDRCVAKTNDARRCASKEALGALPDDTKLGSGEGEIRVSATRPLRYELVAEFGDDVQFSIVAAPVGARKRVCLPAGRGDCPNSGVW